MIIYSVKWDDDYEGQEEFFKTKKEAITFAESYPWDGEEYPMRITRVEIPRPGVELLFTVIKSQGGGYVLSQKNIWKNEAQKKQDKMVAKLGWDIE